MGGWFLKVWVEFFFFEIDLIDQLRENWISCLPDISEPTKMRVYAEKKRI